MYLLMSVYLFVYAGMNDAKELGSVCQIGVSGRSRGGREAGERSARAGFLYAHPRPCDRFDAISFPVHYSSKLRISPRSDGIYITRETNYPSVS